MNDGPLQLLDPRPADGAHAPVPPVPRRERTLQWAVAGALVLMAVVMVWPRRALWLDEAQSVAIARASSGSIVDGLRADGAPPLYYVLLHGWMRVFGSGDMAVRALSIVAAVAAVVVLAHVAGRLFGGGWAAVVTVLVVGSNPFFVRYATEARMYALVFLEVGLGMLAIDWWLRDRRRAGLLLSFAVAWSLALTHYWGIFVLVATGTCVVGAALHARDRRHRRALWLQAAAITAGVAATAFWWPVLRFQSAHTGTPWTRPVSALHAVVITVHRSTGPLAPAALVSIGIASTMAAAAIVAVVVPRHVRDGTETAQDRNLHAGAIRWIGAVFVVTWSLAFLATLLTRSGFVARYTSAMFPLEMLMAVGGILWWRRSRWVPLVVGLLWACGMWVAIAQIDAPRTRAPEFAAVLASEASSEDLVVYCPDQLGPPLDRLLQRNVDVPRQWVFPTKGSPERVDWIDYRQRHLASSPRAFATDADRVAGPGTIWLVVSTTHPPTEASCGQLVDELAERRAGIEFVPADERRWPSNESMLAFFGPPG